jgi:hypothetical protein
VPPDYLTVADLLGMHTMLIQRYGGAPGARDPCIKCYYLKFAYNGLHYKKLAISKHKTVCHHKALYETQNLI